MLVLLLTLILLPFIASVWAQKKRPKNLWVITGVAFGVVAYPFLAATTIPLMYGGALGNAILSITNPLTLLHRFPGKVLFHLIYGHAIRDDINFLLVALNAVVWGAVYGLIGYYLDQGKSGKVIKFLLVICCAPLLIWLIANFTAVISLLDEVVDRKGYGYICRRVINTDESTEVWMRIGNLRSSMSEKAVTGKQLCSKVDLSKGPFQVLLGDIQHPVMALDIPVTGGKKTCIGLSPNFSGASSQSADWTAKVIDCPLEQ